LNDEEELVILRAPAANGGAGGGAAAASLSAPAPAAAAGADEVASPRIEASAPALVSAAPPAPEALAGLSVLLVDDERDVRRLGEAQLRRLGCDVLALEDGADVARALEEAARPFDALVLDIHMRRSDGAEVCADLRAGRHLRCAAVALTAATAPADVARYYARGFDAVLAKPFGLRTLAATLAEARAAAAARLGTGAGAGNARIARMKSGAGRDSEVSGDGASVA
jgi:CheY-like chemotaxis protein